jgi:predicted DNA-binding transcriptional regulator AlpA
VDGLGDPALVGPVVVRPLCAHRDRRRVTTGDNFEAMNVQLATLDDVTLAIERALANLDRPTSEPWLAAERAAQHVDMTEDAFRKNVERGHLPTGRRLGGRLRWRASELDAAITDGDS